MHKQTFGTFKYLSQTYKSDVKAGYEDREQFGHGRGETAHSLENIFNISPVLTNIMETPSDRHPSKFRSLRSPTRLPSGREHVRAKWDQPFKSRISRKAFPGHSRYSESVHHLERRLQEVYRIQSSLKRELRILEDAQEVSDTLIPWP